MISFFASFLSDERKEYYTRQAVSDFKQQFIVCQEYEMICRDQASPGYDSDTKPAL